MATGWRTPANPVVSTYAESGEDYDDLNTWESATDTNLVMEDAGQVLDILDDADHDDWAGSVAGATTDATRFRVIQPQSGAEHDGTSDNGAFLDNTAVEHIFNLSENFATVQGLILKSIFNDAATKLLGKTGGAASECYYIDCIGFDSANAGAGVITGLRQVFGPSYVIKCVIDNMDGDGIHHNMGASEIGYMYNCITVNIAGKGFDHSGSGSGSLINNISDGNTGEDFDTGGTYTATSNNASSDTTAETIGTSSHNSETFTFKTGANNWQLDTTDTSAANDGGKDLSADSIFSFDQDIVGATWNVWDIGINEPDVAGGAPARTSRLGLMGYG